MSDDKFTYLTTGEGLDKWETKKTVENLKKLISLINRELNSYKFYDEIIYYDQSERISCGISEKEVAAIPGKIRTLVLAKAFLAYLQRAQDRLEQEETECDDLTLLSYARMKGIELPEMPQYNGMNPQKDPKYIEHTNIDECCRYYMLKAEAAAIGQYIHKKGRFNKSRQRLFEAYAKPVTLSGEGTATMIYEITPAFDAEMVDAMFFRLQDWQRECQKKFNTVTFNREKLLDQIQADRLAAYDAARKKYDESTAELWKEYDAYRNSKWKRVRSLRIRVLPVFEEINTLCHQEW